MSAEDDAAIEVCGALEQVRQELDYIGKQLDNSDLGDRRERIATAAMQALASNGALISALKNRDGVKPAQFPLLLAKVSVEYADALIAELAKPMPT